MIFPFTLSLPLWLSSPLALFFFCSFNPQEHLFSSLRSRFINHTGDKIWRCWRRFLHQKSPMAVFQWFPPRFPRLTCLCSICRWLLTTMQRASFCRATSFWPWNAWIRGSSLYRDDFTKQRVFAVSKTRHWRFYVIP